MIDCIQAAAGSHDRRSKDTKRGRIFAAFTYLDKYRRLLSRVDNLRFVHLTKVLTGFLGVYPPPEIAKRQKKPCIQCRKGVNCKYHQTNSQHFKSNARGFHMYLHDNTNIMDMSSKKRDVLTTARVKRQYRDAASKFLGHWLTDRGQEALDHCGNYVVMQETADRQRQRVELGYYCKQRLCPCCAWRRSVKDAQTIAAISAAAAADKMIMIMVTLTVPNVRGCDLAETIRHINQSFARLRKQKACAALLANTIRKIEVTYNRQMETYHPHLHILCYVPSTYWTRGNYCSHDTLLDGWRQATGQAQITQVDVRRCRDYGDTDAIRELAKYNAKASDYCSSQQVMDDLYIGLKNTQLISFGGKMREYKRDYDAGRLDEYIERDDVAYTLRVVYEWIADDYAEIEVSERDVADEALEAAGWHQMAYNPWEEVMGNAED